MELIPQVRQTIATHHLFGPQARLVVGVSGGPDSIALLHILTRLRSFSDLTLHLAHLDHGLRPDSHEDATFVQELAARWHLPSTIERREVKRLCAQQGWSLEDGARRLRYQFFLEVARRHNATHVALAHTADDQAETVLMRLVRGTGLLGLGAIPIRRLLDTSAMSTGRGETTIWLVRPLLETWRRELLAYLRDQKLSYKEDTTNADTRFVRNRIRHELLPLLEREYNPNIKGTLTQLAEQSRSDYAYLQASAGRQWKRIARSPSKSQVSITVPRFIRQPKALQRQLVRCAIQRVRGDLGQFEFRHWLEVERLFLEQPVGTILNLPGRVQLRREAERVICELTAASSPTTLPLLD